MDVATKKLLCGLSSAAVIAVGLFGVPLYSVAFGEALTPTCPTPAQPPASATNTASATAPATKPAATPPSVPRPTSSPNQPHDVTPISPGNPPAQNPIFPPPPGNSPLTCPNPPPTGSASMSAASSAASSATLSNSASATPSQSVSPSQASAQAPQQFVVAGTITAVDKKAGTLTLSVREGTNDLRGRTITITMRPNILVTLNGKKVALGELRAGYTAGVLGTHSGLSYSAGLVVATKHR